MIRWISGIALGFLFLVYILLSPSFFFNFGLIIIFGISIYELIKLRVFSFQSLLAFILIVTAILCLYLYELERSLILIAVPASNDLFVQRCIVQRSHCMMSKILMKW